MTRCSVPNCTEPGSHRFPKDPKIRKLWLKAIRRIDFEPKSQARLCRKHFKESDYGNVSKYTGVEHQHKFLRKSAVPSIFPWNQKPVTKDALARSERLEARNCRKCLFQPGASTSQGITDIVPLLHDECIDANVSLNVEIPMPETIHSTTHSPEKKNITQGTQTSNILRLFSTELLLTDNESVIFYTGLETFEKFTFVLSTLLPMAHNIKYRWSRVIGMSVEDQFLIMLIKLRRNKPDFEIAKMFGVSKTEISNIVITWVNFVHDIWSLIEIWPSRELINYYMPESFRRDYPSTRLIIDGTEIPIQKPSQPDAQKASFSQCKHKNTLKFLVGSSPGGLLTYCSGAYAGSASDRQIVERSKLFQLCESGDSIMADRGFNVQDCTCTQVHVSNNSITFSFTICSTPIKRTATCLHDALVPLPAGHSQCASSMFPYSSILICSHNQDFSLFYGIFLSNMCSCLKCVPGQLLNVSIHTVAPLDPFSYWYMTNNALFGFY